MYLANKRIDRFAAYSLSQKRMIFIAPKRNAWIFKEKNSAVLFDIHSLSYQNRQRRTRDLLVVSRENGAGAQLRIYSSP